MTSPSAYRGIYFQKDLWVLFRLLESLLFGGEFLGNGRLIVLSQEDHCHWGRGEMVRGRQLLLEMGGQGGWDIGSRENIFSLANYFP